MDRIEVWPVRLCAAGWQIEYARSLLSPDECGRADRFRFEEHRIRFVLAHGVLRRLIGSYTGSLSQVRFVCGAHGKPALDGASLEFNLSHSGDYAAYAFSTVCPVGIDIEVVRPEPQGLKLSRQFFSAEEAEALARGGRDDAFLVVWTRKEACLKAMGTGIAAGLDAVRVSTDPDADATTASAPGGRRLTLHTFHAGDVVGAVAWEGLQREPLIHEVRDASALLAGSPAR